jgi:DNA-binding transcriptional regulator YiaG
MNVFQWLAGADQKILDQCSDLEKNKITGFGTLVIIPAIVGIFSMTYAVSTITDNSYLYYLAGFVWFLIILFFDRFMISTLHKSENTDTKSVYGWAVFTRYVFALIVGIAVAHPMTLLWFDKGIKEGITKEHRKEFSQNDSIYRENSARLRTGIDDLRKTQECLRILLTAEQSGGRKVELPCGYSSGLPGNSRRCEEIKRQIDDIERLVQEEENRISGNLAMLKAQRDNDSISIETTKSFDYLARVRMLSKLEEGEGGSDIWWVKIFMILLFVFVDVLPITMKISTSYGEYEAIRDSMMHKTQTLKKAENKAVDAYAVTYTKISTAKLNHEAQIGEMANLFDMTCNVVNDIENKRKKYDNTAQDILQNISLTTDKDLLVDYTKYWVSIRKMFDATVKKGEDKLIDYLKTL